MPNEEEILLPPPRKGASNDVEDILLPPPPKKKSSSDTTGTSSEVPLPNFGSTTLDEAIAKQPKAKPIEVKTTTEPTDATTQVKPEVNFDPNSIKNKFIEHPQTVAQFNEKYKTDHTVTEMVTGTQAWRHPKDHPKAVEEEKDAGVVKEAIQSTAAGLDATYGMIARMPNMLYNTFALPVNAALQAMGKEGNVSAGNNVFEKSAQFYDEQAKQNLAEQQAKYDKSIFDEFNEGDKGKAIHQLSNAIIQMLPPMMTMAGASMVGASPAAVEVGGALGFGSQKYKEIQDLPIPETTKMSNALANGMLMSMFNKWQLDKMTIPVAKALETGGEEAAVKTAKEIFADTYNSVFSKLAPITEPITSATNFTATVFANNVLDKIQGVDPNKDLSEGLGDAFIQGMALGVGSHTGTRILNRERRDKIGQLHNETEQLKTDADKPDLNPQVKETILQTYQDKTEQLNTELKKDKENAQKYTSEEKSFVDDLSEKVEQNKIVINNPSVSPETKNIKIAENEKLNGDIDKMNKDVEKRKLQEYQGSKFINETGLQPGLYTKERVDEAKKIKQDENNKAKDEGKAVSTEPKAEGDNGVLDNKATSITRHGETERDQQDKISGATNEPLSEKGKVEAENKAEVFNKEWTDANVPEDKRVIVASPLKRTVQTSEIIAGKSGAKIVEEPKLSAWDVKDFHGMKDDEWKPIEDWFVNNPDATKYEGEGENKGKEIAESFNQFSTRQEEGVKENKEKYPDAKFVMHGAGLKWHHALQETGGDKEKARELFIKNENPNDIKIGQNLSKTEIKTEEGTIEHAKEEVKRAKTKSKKQAIQKDIDHAETLEKKVNDMSDEEYEKLKNEFENGELNEDEFLGKITEEYYGETKQSISDKTGGTKATDKSGVQKDIRKEQLEETGIEDNSGSEVVDVEKQRAALRMSQGEFVGRKMGTAKEYQELRDSNTKETNKLNKYFAKKVSEIIPVKESEVVKTIEDVNKEYLKRESDWLGNKFYREHEANVIAHNQQEAIKATVPKQKGETDYSYKKEWTKVDKAIQIYIDLKTNPGHIKEFYDKLIPSQKEIVDLSQNLTDKQKEIAKQISDEYKKVGEEALDAGQIKNVLDNYVARSWNMEGKKSLDLSNFQTSTRHSLQRTLGSILEGWAKGYELKVEGATNNLAILKTEIGRAIENKNFIEEGTKLKLPDGESLFVMRPQDGYVKIENPSFKKWEYAGTLKDYIGTDMEAFGKRKDILITENGTVLKKGDIYAPEKIAKGLNNILGKSKLYELPGVEALSKFSNMVKSSLFLTSFFHHLAFARAHLLAGGENFLNVKDLNPLKAYKKGLQQIHEFNPELKLLVENGLTFGKMQDWDELHTDNKNVLGKMMDKHNFLPEQRAYLQNLYESQNKWLFEKYGAGLKALDALNYHAKLLKDKPEMDADERAAIVARYINQNYGGLNLVKMKRNPTTQHLMRLLLLAGDWTESNLQMAADAFKSGEQGDFARRMWARVLVRGTMATVAANLLTALGADDEEDKKLSWEQRVKSRYAKAWKEGHLRWLDVDLTPLYHGLGGKDKKRVYFSLFGHFSDPLKMVTNPVDFLENKLNPATVKPAFEALTGENWKHEKFTTVDELLGFDDKGLYKRNQMPTAKKEMHLIGQEKGGKLKGHLTAPSYEPHGGIGYKEFPSFALSQIRGMMPTQLQNIEMWGTGENDGVYSIAQSIGLGLRISADPDKKDVSNKKK